MSNSGFTITLNSQQVQDALNDLAGRLDNLKPAMEDIGRALQNITEDAFAAEASPFGGAWPDLSPVTKARREALGKWPGPKLQMTAGGLAASIFYDADATRVVLGAPKVYAATQQFGRADNRMYNTARGHPAPIPPRPFLPVNPAGELPPAARDEILAILAGYLARVCFNPRPAMKPGDSWADCRSGFVPPVSIHARL